jgi:hypothetical protein
MVRPCPAGPPPPRQRVNLPAGFAPVPTRLIDFTSVPDSVAQVEAASPPLPVAKEKPRAASSAAQASKEQSPGGKPTQVAGSEVAKKSDPARSPSLTELASAKSEITGAIPGPTAKSSGAARQNLIGAVGFGLAALRLLSTSLLLSRRRSRSSQLAVPISQEPVEADTLYRKGAPGPLDAASRIPHGQAPSARLPREDEWLPSTLGEALIVLCASPETERDMLKELVKGLRRRWHPDYALHDEDRRVRERKLKQINVAWDIVCGKRRARRPIRTQAA